MRAVLLEKLTLLSSQIRSIRFGARSSSDSRASSPVDCEPFLPLLFYRFSGHSVARENPVPFLCPSTLWERDT